jgi:hypothetical protein
MDRAGRAARFGHFEYVPLKSGLSFFDEGGQALLGVHAGAHHAEGLHFQGQSGPQIDFTPPVHGLLDGPHGDAPPGSDGSRRLHGFLHQAFRRKDLVDQADGHGLVGRQHLSGHAQFLGPVLAHQSGQALGAAETGDESQVDFRLPEPGPVRA